MQQLFASIKDC
ncbi:hypothetical protein LINPERPRIM_LOCUS37158 [Linum perenne]